MGLAGDEPLTLEEGHHKGRARKWSVLAVLSVAVFIIVIDTTILNVAVSQVVVDLKTTVTGVQTAISMYALVLAAFMITGGKLADIWGRKRAFIIGTVIFTIGTGLTALAQNLGMLILGWSVLEGLGGALMLPAIGSLIMVNFESKKDRAICFAVIGAVVAGGASLGPIVGGWIATAFGWKWAFAIEVVIALVVLAFTYVIADEPLKEKRHLDVLGVVLSALGLGLVVFGILQSSKWGFFKARGGPIQPFGLSLVPFIILAGLVVIICFLMWTRRQERIGKEPLIRLRLFKNRTLSSGLVMNLITNLVQAGMLFALALYLQMVLELNPMATGIGMLPISITLLVASLTAPKLSQWIPPKRLVQIGMIFMAAGSFFLAFAVPVKSTRANYIIGLALAGAGVGLLAAMLGHIVIDSVTIDEGNEASALNSTAQNLGSSLGTALIGAILIGVLSFGIVSRANASKILPPEAKSKAEDVVKKDAEVVSTTELRKYLTEVPEDIANEVVRINDESRSDALTLAMLVAGIISVIGFGVSLFLPKMSVVKKEREEKDS